MTPARRLRSEARSGKGSLPGSEKRAGVIIVRKRKVVVWSKREGWEGA